jgi:hypothetical protein
VAVATFPSESEQPVNTPDRLFNLLGAIVVVALVTTLVAHKNTAKVVNSLGGTFVSSLRAAQGR